MKVPLKGKVNLPLCFINPLMPELNPTKQHNLPRFFAGDI